MNEGLADLKGTERMTNSGYRLTPQRRHVYGILLQKKDHPTANEVFLRAKQALPDISMATVYNCLDALVQSGLVTQVNLDRGATRYCVNMEDHCHFHCDSCDGIFDVDYRSEWAKAQIPMPAGFSITHFQVALRGTCSACAAHLNRAQVAQNGDTKHGESGVPIPIKILDRENLRAKAKPAVRGKLKTSF
jgi:Fe2+ or Zn2+ uptake regulation protein